MLPVNIEQLGKELKPKFEMALLINDENKMKVLIAVNSSDDKKMIMDDVADVTGIDQNNVEKIVDFFEKIDYMDTILEEIPGRSIHKICILKDGALKIMKELGI